MTAIVAGTFSLFCSTLLHRPTASTAVAYTFCAFWLFAYPVISILTLEVLYPAILAGIYGFSG